MNVLPLSERYMQSDKAMVVGERWECVEDEVCFRSLREVRSSKSCIFDVDLDLVPPRWSLGGEEAVSTTVGFGISRYLFISCQWCRTGLISDHERKLTDSLAI